MCQKYVNTMPLYRQEKEWGKYGIKLSCATLATGVLVGFRIGLCQLQKLCTKRFLKREVLHVDETMV